MFSIMQQEIGRAYQFDEDIISREALPYPFVTYTHCFLGFQKDLDARIVFCSCSRTAIENNLEICRMGASGNKSDDRHALRFYKDFSYPKILLRAASVLANNTYPSSSHGEHAWRSCREPHLTLLRIETLQRLISYQDSLCHKCCIRLPYSQYGFSAYVHEALYGYGLFNFGDIALPDKCPEELKGMSKEDRYLFVLDKVSYALCFPARGKKGSQESIVYLLVRQIFPQSNVIRHHRPLWLEGLELDVFVEEHQLGIEFQGVQHSRAFKYLGGERALRQIQRRDKRKAALCKSNGIKLVTIDENEDEELTDKSIYQKIKAVIPSLEYQSPYKIEKPNFDISIYLQ